MSSSSAVTGLSQLFENTFKNQPECRLYISNYLELIKQSNPHFDEAQISLAEQNLWAEFYRQCLQAMGEVSFNCLAILDIQGRLLGMNHQAERTLGYTSAQLVGKSVFNTLFSEQQGRDYASCLQQALTDPQTNVFSRRWEIVLTRPNGALFPIELRLNRLKIFGSSALLVNFNDITKQKWTFDALYFNEERYRKTIAENADAIFFVDPQTKRITEANPAFNILLGYKSEELLSLTLYDLMEEEPQKLDEWLDFRRFRGTELLVREEKRLLNKANQWIQVELSCSVFEQRGQHVICMIARDSSERKILKRPRLLLEKLENTGLVDTLNEISSLLETLHPAKGQGEKLQTLRTLYQHLCDLLENALPAEQTVTATQQVDQLVLPQQPFSLRALVNALKFLFHQTAQSRGLQLYHSVEEDVPDAYLGEPHRLQHILYQLLDNALRHTEAGNILLKVRMVEHTDHTVTLLFMVRDTGTGVKEGVQPVIRQLFEQGMIPEQHALKGLIWVKRYIDDLKGKIWFNTLLGQGTTFLFQLTLHQSAEAPRHSPDFDPEVAPPDFISPPMGSAPPSTPRIKRLNLQEVPKEAEEEVEVTAEEDSQAQEQLGSGVTPASPQRRHILEIEPSLLTGLEMAQVLLVDDDLETMLQFQRFVIGYPVLFSCVDNGRKALEMVKEKNFDLILMDLHMPIMDGYTATQRIRLWEKEQNKQETPIIGLFAEAENLTEAEGFQAMESKPNEQKALLSLLAHYLPAWSARIPQAQVEEASFQNAPEPNEPIPQAQVEEAVTSAQPSPPPPSSIQVKIPAQMASHAPAFLEKRQQDLVRMEEALLNGDLGLIRILGKNMKNTGSVFGFTEIADMGIALEKGAAESDEALIVEYLDKLRNYLASVEVVVES